MLVCCRPIAASEAVWEAAKASAVAIAAEWSSAQNWAIIKSDEWKTFLYEAFFFHFGEVFWRFSAVSYLISVTAKAYIKRHYTKPFFCWNNRQVTRNENKKREFTMDVAKAVGWLDNSSKLNWRAKFESFWLNLIARVAWNFLHWSKSSWCYSNDSPNHESPNWFWHEKSFLLLLTHGQPLALVSNLLGPRIEQYREEVFRFQRRIIHN